MSDNDTNLLERVIDDESRRSFLKKSAVATVGATAATSGVASAQDGGGDQGPWKGLMFNSEFYPTARFTFVSDVVEWTPNYGEVNSSWFSNYNTRMIRWLNTGEQAQLFVAQDADIGQYSQELGFVVDDQDQNQPQVYEVSPEWTAFSDSEELVTINFSPADEETEDQILASDDWWQNG